MHESEFDAIFGCNRRTVKAFIEDDKTGWLESDYNEALNVLEKLQRDNPDQYEDFRRRFLEVEELEEAPFQVRCGMIYLLLSSYVDWRASNAVLIKGPDMSMIFEKVYLTSPSIKLDFQNVAEQIANFEPSEEQIKVWTEVFSQAIKSPVPPEESREIVRDMGKRKKAGRKP